MDRLYKQLDGYIMYLGNKERSRQTRKQYRKDVEDFLRYLGGGPLTKEAVIEYKEMLMRDHLPASVNTKLAAVNGFLGYIGEETKKVRHVKQQTCAYLPRARELTRSEYNKLVRIAERKGDEKYALLLQTLGGTGIRISELRYITAESLVSGEARVDLKGKIRMILIPEKLRRKLRTYARKRNIESGPLFITRSGRPLDRSNIWKKLKRIAKAAGVTAAKVFPHNIRHLFAVCFYSNKRDIAKLADVLGHSSVNTTRIYIKTSGDEHMKMIESLRLVL